MVAVVPTTAVEGGLHDEITGGLLVLMGTTTTLLQDLEADAPLESVAVMVTVKVPVEL